MWLEVSAPYQVAHPGHCHWCKMQVRGRQPETLVRNKEQRVEATIDANKPIGPLRIHWEVDHEALCHSRKPQPENERVHMITYTK